MYAAQATPRHIERSRVRGPAYLEGEHKVELHLLLVQDADANQTAQECVTLEQTTGVLPASQANVVGGEHHPTQRGGTAARKRELSSALYTFGTVGTGSTLFP